jgi:hypothetical protein
MKRIAKEVRRPGGCQLYMGRCLSFGAEGNEGHKKAACPAKNMTCYNCTIKGHFARVCNTQSNLNLVMNGGPTKQTSPRIKERAKEVSSSEDSLTVVYDRKTPVVVMAQDYVNQTHPTLPIRSLSDPGTPGEQMAKWASENPTRLVGIREEITKWEGFFANLKKYPDDIKVINKAGRQQAEWWKEFLSGGSGGLREVQRAMKHCK